MTTNPRSATAVDKLIRLTEQYNIAAALHFDYLKVVRALNILEEHLKEVDGDKSAVLQWITSCREFADLKRTELNDYCEKKHARIEELNGLLQNGALNDETR